jgi:hypothetical protein
MHNGDGDSAKQPEGYEALLVVTEPVVFIRNGETTKHDLRVCEIEVVSLQVGLALGIVPLESHLQSVYTPSG